jgi:hypothetical protein
MTWIVKRTTSIRTARRWLSQGLDVRTTLRLRHGYWRRNCRIVRISQDAGQVYAKSLALKWYNCDAVFFTYILEGIK